MNAVVTYAEKYKMAESLAASGFFGFKNAHQVLALGMIAEAEGRPFATVAQDYHIIQGKPALKADTILARFFKNGGKVKWIQVQDSICDAYFKSEKYGSEVTISWDLDRARRAGLTSDMYKKYPRAMLRARVIAEGVRLCDPSVFGGMYTVEEMQDVELRAETAMIAKLPETADADVDPERKAHETRMRYLRGKLNQALLAGRDIPAKDDDELFTATCKQFQREQGKGIWETLTTHNGTETFRSVADEHLNRITDKKEAITRDAEIKLDFRERLDACADLIRFDELSIEFDENPILNRDMEIKERLRDRGRSDFGAIYRDDLEDETETVIKEERADTP